ncbi:Gfo/Idh/MocA family protein [[Limnothrix rosea] IAM M-220]|uniref:Gfo/Idh/MocA family protein n=1 Tax=[Limnothrix rosea] IAM M-220 TaxID=454133 RepID=UPI0009652EBA|nr:Gfo/Idh/MocA family oxidoreductase [[Limnothrix rosea] IAM M-220]OKH16078.1 glycosyl transferase family 2 [[Limnothrix rosea] IAM M-220]
MSQFQVGIVGTGYAAKCRADAFRQDSRGSLRVVTGYRRSSRENFAAKYQLEPIATWQELVQRSDLDVVVICNINREHGAIAKAALEADKHVVVEYPLALDPVEAAALIDLAKTKQKLLHVEHIEILGSLHQTIRSYLPKLGQVFYARYITLAPKRHPLPHWTFHYEDYGFPLVAALSRVNRLIDLFGEVQTVRGAADFLPAAQAGYYQGCLCSAQFKFQSDVIAHLTYGKGSQVMAGDRRFTICGDQGTLDFNGSQGTLTQGETVTPIELGSRRGVFKQDTTAVLDYLAEGKPLYIQPEQSLYALEIADQIRRDALSIC